MTSYPYNSSNGLLTASATTFLCPDMIGRTIVTILDSIRIRGIVGVVPTVILYPAEAVESAVDLACVGAVGIRKIGQPGSVENYRNSLTR